MLKIIYYGIFFTLVGAVAVFFAENQGTIAINWLGYSIETTVPVMVLFAVFVFWLWNLVVQKPMRFFARKKQMRIDDFAYTDLMNTGMSMVLASDIEGAKKAEKKLIKKVGSVPILSMAIAVAEKDSARRLACAETLLLDEKTSLFGLKGLIDYYYERKEYDKALDYATRALKKEPVVWAYKTVVDLKIKNTLYKDALDTLEKGKKFVPADEFSAMKLSLLMKLSEDDKDNREKYLEAAIKINRGFAPAILSLAAYYKENGKDNRALKVLKNGFAAKPDLLLFDFLVKNWKDSSEIVKLSRELVGNHSDESLGEQILGESYIHSGIWGQALLHLKNAVRDGKIDGRIALNLAKAEKELGHEEEVEKWNRAVINAEMASKWRCSLCGHEYAAWQVSCTSCGGFGTVTWDNVSKVGTEIVPL